MFAATIGITQNDIKKVLAYSTVSQLGFMFLACGVGAFVIGIFHVMTHAFFKALMFLGAGSVIHAMHHEQDMRRMGGLKKYMPKTYWTSSPAGSPSAASFRSAASGRRMRSCGTRLRPIHPGRLALWLVATIAATCTAFYMTRLMAMTFWGKERFLEVRAGGQADEAHAQATPTGAKPHDGREPIGRRPPAPRPRERVGAAHALDGSRRRAEGVTRAATNTRPHDPATRPGTATTRTARLPHESPPSMWVPLAVLAVLATVGGFVGISPAFTGGEHVGGKLNIVNWFGPVIWNPETREFQALAPKALGRTTTTHAQAARQEHAPSRRAR